MPIIEGGYEVIWDATFQLVLLSSLLIGATSGILGAFAVLRRRSLLGDALAHAALPGVALAFLWTQSKALPVLLLGATVSGVVGVLVIEVIVSYTRIKADAALGIVLSVFFGIGIVLLTHIQQSEVGNQSGLDKFLFGQAASVVRADLYVMCTVSALVMIVVCLFYKEFKGLIFDAEFLAALGFSPRLTDLLLMGLIVLTVMVGLQAVGVILIAAMLITPAAAARFWTDRLHVMVFVSGILGALCGALGVALSALAPRIPTGPVMVLVATAAFLVSVLIAPRRGVLARRARRRANARRENGQHFLRAFAALQAQSRRSVALSDLAGELQVPRYRVHRLAKRLARDGWVTLCNGACSLTEQGQQEADFVVKSHRLWEYYLVYQSILEQDHVDRPADEVEHILTPEIIAQLETILARENIDVVGDIHKTGSKYRRTGDDA